MSKKTIDYLFEDPPISQQRFALVSIVGPHMPQKCDVWGIKIRGVAESVEKAKGMTQKLMKIDNNYDIYTVEVGKFFPLAVEPHEVGEVEYENQQLNELIKNYLANREAANEQWHQRKSEMIKDAIREGKAQEELSNRPEHPVAVLQRIKSFEERMKSLQEDIDCVAQDLDLARTKFQTYSEEERATADSELQSVIKQITTESETKNESTEMSLNDIRKQLGAGLSELGESSSSVLDDSIKKVLVEIESTEQELQELNAMKTSLDPKTSPNVYRRVCQQITEITEKLQSLKLKLNNSEHVNQFINDSYTASEWNSLENSEPTRYKTID
uniref:Uncharacterized protein n=1 Tax=viral metagenome TaxID=1070528 RepID=A0A6C0H7F7_9ZZZZ